MRLNLRVNRTALWQYMLIYMSAQYFGGRVMTALGADIFFPLVLLIIAFTIIIRRNLFIQKNCVNRYFGFLFFILLYLGISVVFTSGGMTIGTMLSLLSRFLLIYISVAIDPDEYLMRLVKLVAVFASISDIIFVSHFIGLTPLLAVISRWFYRIPSGMWYGGDTYGLFFFVFKLDDLTRNSYMFGEPGEYQMIINTALFFLLFFSNRIYMEDKQKRNLLILFLITLLTIQSTSGFFSLAVILTLSLLQNRNTMGKAMRRLLIAIVFVVLTYCAFFASKDSILYTALIDKITSSTGHIDLAQSTGADRVNPYFELMLNLKGKPLQVIFGVGPNGLESTSLGEYSANGIVNLIMMCGIVFVVPLYYYMIKKNVKYSNNIFSSIAAVFIVINQGLGQPEMISIFSILILLYPYIFYLNMFRYRKFLD